MVCLHPTTKVWHVVVIGFQAFYHASLGSCRQAKLRPEQTCCDDTADISSSLTVLNCGCPCCLVQNWLGSNEMGNGEMGNGEMGNGEMGNGEMGNGADSV